MAVRIVAAVLAAAVVPTVAAVAVHAVAVTAEAAAVPVEVAAVPVEVVPEAAQDADKRNRWPNGHLFSFKLLNS